jgi:hypothetical protein
VERPQRSEDERPGGRQAVAQDLPREEGDPSHPTKWGSNEPIQGEVVSTGRHHGFESLAEQQLLLALDFAGEATDVLSQPFRLRFAAASGWREHTPDFLVIDRGGQWLFDVRPAERIGPDDLGRVSEAA